MSQVHLEWVELCGRQSFLDSPKEAPAQKPSGQEFHGRTPLSCNAKSVNGWGWGRGGEAAETRIRMVPAESEWPISMPHPTTDLQEVQPNKVSLPQPRKAKPKNPIRKAVSVSPNPPGTSEMPSECFPSFPNQTPRPQLAHQETGSKSPGPTLISK